MKYQRHFIFVLSVLLLMQIGVFFYYRNVQNDRTNISEHYGYIRSVSSNGFKTDLAIDEIEFLSGEAAVVAGVKDTKCSAKNISECIPSMNNDFYIRNLNTSTTTYVLSPKAYIEIFANPGSPVLKRADLEDFLEKYGQPEQIMKVTPFKFYSKGKVITSLSAQYTP